MNINLRWLFSSLALLALGSCGGASGDAPTQPVVPAPVVTTVQVSLSASSILAGQSATASAKVLDQNGATLLGRAVQWSTTNTSIATISSAGELKALSPGQTSVVASVEGKVGEASVLVTTGPPARIDLTPLSAVLQVGGSLVITAIVRDAAGIELVGKTVSWSGSDINALSGTVDGNKLTVTAHTASVVSVVATIDAVTSTTVVTIPAPTAAAVARVDMSSAAVVLNSGQKLTISAIPRDASGNALPSKIVSWFTSDGSIVGGSVNGNSVELLGGGAGSATVSAVVDGVTGRTTVQVLASTPVRVASVTITPASAQIAVGGSTPMIATLRDANGNALTDRIVTWTSSAPTIASGSFVNAFATIAGVAQGIATINATSEGVTGSATVSVVATSGGGIQLTCAGVAGGRIYGNDGVYLGRLTNQFDAESILNQFGSYGGQFGTYSMYNTFGQYGSAFSALSAFNTLTATPPLLFVNGNFAAFVTKNTIKVPRVDPAALRTCNF